MVVIVTSYVFDLLSVWMYVCMYVCMYICTSAEVLIQADKLLGTVKSGFWKSEFQQMLGAALNKQVSQSIDQSINQSINQSMLII